MSIHGINPPPEPMGDPISDLINAINQMFSDLISFLLIIIDEHLGFLILIFGAVLLFICYVSFILSACREGQRAVYDAGKLSGD